jgi:hypothetical protein
MHLRTTRRFTNAFLRGVHLPLAALELAPKRPKFKWMFAPNYELLEANTKRILGIALRDEELVRQADIHRGKLEDWAQAERLRAEAQMKCRLGDPENRI